MRATLFSILAGVLAAVPCLGGWVLDGQRDPGGSDAPAGVVTADGSTPMTGALNMGGNSITNVGTNSLTFANGTRLSTGINGTLSVGGSSTSPVPLVTSATFAGYETPETVYSVDGYTMKRTGNRFSVQDWIPDNLNLVRYSTWNHFETQNRGLLDGPGYWFSDQGGVITNLSSGQVWGNPGYKNLYTMSSNAFFSVNASNIAAVIQTDITAVPSPSIFSVMCRVKPNYMYDDWGEGWGPVKCAIAAVKKWPGFGVGGFYMTLSTCSWAGPPNADKFTVAVGPEGGESFWAYPDLATNGIWADFAFTFNNGTGTVYHNGVSLGTVFHGENTAIYPNEEAIYVVGDQWNNMPGHDIDYAGWWNRELTAGEIEAIHTAGEIKGASLAGTLFAYNFEEGSGVVATDESGNENDATINEYCYWETNGIFTLYATNMVLTATNSLLSFVPNYVFASTLINVGTNTLAPSNVVLSCSRDGATTWSLSDSVTVADTWDMSNKLVTGMIVMTNQPTGSNVYPRVWITNTAPAVTVKGITMPCGE